MGTEFEIDVRGRRVRARVVPEPFYKRPRPARSVSPVSSAAPLQEP
jgi:glycine cleavage system aminomethyltransferase T